MTKLPKLENLDARMEFRLTETEKRELYMLAGKKNAPKWVRWGVQQALKQLRNQTSEPSVTSPKSSM